MKNNQIYLSIRIFFFLLIAATLTIQTGIFKGGTRFLLSFLYFTIQSNFFVVLYLGISIVKTRTSKTFFARPAWIHGGVTMYIAVTGLIYNILLSSAYNPTGFAWVMNIVLHTISPLFFVVDWILTQDRRTYRLRDFLF